MMKSLFTLTLALLASIFSFGQNRYLDDVFSEVTVTTDIVYGTGLNANNQEQTLALDVYEPSGDQAAERIAIVLAHGGSFLPDAGVKDDAYMVDYATAMAKKGFVVFAISYRVGWQISATQETNSRNILPAAWRGIQDYKTAVRFVRKTIAADGNPYRVESERIIGAGFGAGGYLPVNMMAIDRPAEIEISPELMQKDFFGNPNGTPYIDTTIQNLQGIAYSNGPWSNYSYEVPFIANYSGAVPTLKLFNQGNFPLIISVHSENDEATPYDSDIVFAGGVIPVIEVFGSFAIHEELDGDGLNTFFNDENRDGYIQSRIPSDSPEDNMYRKGLLTFPNQPYMWSNEDDTYDQNYDPTYVTWMDSVVGYSSPRMERWIQSTGGTGIDVINGAEAKSAFEVYPNPSSDVLTIAANNKGIAVEEIEILDITGKIVRVLKPSAIETTIDISELPANQYLIKIKSSNKIYIHRFAKK